MKIDPPPQPPRPEIASYREFREHLRGDYAVNGRTIWTPGFQAMATYRLGVYCPNIPTKLLRRLGYFFHRRMRFFIRNFYGIELDHRTRIGRRLRIAHQHGIVIHPQAVIGDDCLIRQGVTIGALRKGHTGPPPVLGDRVEVGAGAVIAGSIRVGDGAIIGPNAVVMTNVPPGGIVASPQCRIVAPPPRKVAAPPPREDVAETQPADDRAKADRQETLQ